MYEFYERDVIWSVSVDVWKDIILIIRNDDFSEKVYNYGEQGFNEALQYINEKFNASVEVKDDKDDFYPDFEAENKLLYPDYGFTIN